jgi:uncharacterized protein DUF1905
MDFEFEGLVVEWRGPAPFYFVAIPEEESEDIKFAAKGVEYWGQVPVVVRTLGIDFTTALFPRDGRYLLPAAAEGRDPQVRRHRSRTSLSGRSGSDVSREVARRRCALM